MDFFVILDTKSTISATRSAEIRMYGAGFPRRVGFVVERSEHEETHSSNSQGDTDEQYAVEYSSETSLELPPTPADDELFKGQSVFSPSRQFRPVSYCGHIRIVVRL